MREIKLDKKIIWKFKYKGIYCEVVNWNFESGSITGHENGNWNGYIYINKEQLPKTFRKLLCKQKTYKIVKDRTTWDYYKLEDYFDFHGGITYYELLLDEFTGKARGIKAGCDYLHDWDEGRHYNENYVAQDLQKSVDKFIENFPEYLVWDIRDSKYRKLEEIK